VYEADKAYIKLTTLKKAAVIALRAIYKVASHTFHVYLWDLMPGAIVNESHLFTRIRECRNQQLVQVRQADAAGMTLKPYSAKDTLTFLEKHFVQDSGDQYIIKWMDILRHTRQPGISIYEWCNSFSPLIRSYVRISQTDDLSAQEQHRINQCITSQITDFERSILAQANDKWKPINLADGAFDLDELKKDISSADAKFSIRKYKPSALILEYLVSRASKQGCIPAPSFATAKPNSGKAKFQGGNSKEVGNGSSMPWSTTSGKKI
jgi:hypothetical protein